MARRGPEKRSKKRYPVSNVALEYSEGNLFSFLKRGDPGRHALVDISSDGLQFLAKQELKQGSPLKITVALPDREAVRVRGLVRWVQQIPGKKLFRTGVQFAEQDAEGLRAIGEFEDQLGELSMRVLCNACGASFKTKRKLEGKKAKCPKCAHVIEIIDADPESDIAASGVHVSAPTPDADPGKQLSDDLTNFIRRNLRTRLHLEVVQHAARTNIFAVADLAKVLKQRERTILAICRELQNKGVLREVGVRNFNIAAGTGMRRIILDLQRSSKVPKKRSAVLALVIENEMKK